MSLVPLPYSRAIEPVGDYSAAYGSTDNLNPLPNWKKKKRSGGSSSSEEDIVLPPSLPVGPKSHPAREGSGEGLVSLWPWGIRLQGSGCCGGCSQDNLSPR